VTVLYGRLLEVARVDNVYDGSRWYLDPDDPETRYQSVTWTCTASESAPWLVPWAGKVTAEWMLDNLEALLAFLEDPEYGRPAAVEVAKMEGERQRALAAEIGTWLHDVFEAMLLDHPIPDPPPDMLGRRLDGEVITQRLLDGWAQGLLNFLEDHRPEPFMAEATVCNPVDGDAGTLDFGGVIPGLGRTLLDLKSGKHLPAWLPLQIEGYWHCTEVWLPLGERALMPGFDTAGCLHLRPRYHRGYKLRQVVPSEAAWGEFRRRAASIRWRETQKPVMPVHYPPLQDGTQPLPLLEDMPLRARGALAAAGLVHLADLTEFTATDLLAVRGVGAQTVQRIQELLGDYGLTLTGEGEVA
jgi:hypothetical protein